MTRALKRISSSSTQHTKALGKREKQRLQQQQQQQQPAAAPSTGGSGNSAEVFARMTEVCSRQGQD